MRLYMMKYFLAGMSAVRKLRYAASALIVDGNIMARYMQCTVQVVKTKR